MIFRSLTPTGFSMRHDWLSMSKFCDAFHSIAHARVKYIYIYKLYVYIIIYIYIKSYTYYFQQRSQIFLSESVERSRPDERLFHSD